MRSVQSQNNGLKNLPWLERVSTSTLGVYDQQSVFSLEPLSPPVWPITQVHNQRPDIFKADFLHCMMWPLTLPVR